MTYQQADAMLTGRCRNRRSIARKTYIKRDGENICLLIYDTVVAVLYPDGRVELRMGGYSLWSVKYRLNREILGPMRFYLYTSRGADVLARYGDGGFSQAAKYSFRDGITIDKNRDVTGEDPETPQEKTRAYERNLRQRNKKVRVQTCSPYWITDNLPVGIGDVLREQKHAWARGIGWGKATDVPGAAPVQVMRIMKSSWTGSYWVHVKEVGGTKRSVLGPQNRTNYRHDKFLTAANIANKGDDSDSTIQADSN